MEFHSMDMRGSFKCQSVVNASALVWDSDDESRVIYDETTELIWIANDSKWVSLSGYSDFPQGTEMWFYQNTEPEGWEIVTGTGDELLAVKGITGIYNTGGTVGGGWATPAHSHSLSGHTHGISGLTGTPSHLEGGKADGTGVARQEHTHTISGTAVASGTLYTAIGGSVSNYRPESSVGLICRRL